MKISKRGHVSPFIAMDILAAANRRQEEGADVIHLELGQPSAPPPRAVVDAAKSALESGETGYTEGAGLTPLRRRIADYYETTYGAAVDPDRVVVTTGSSAGFLLAFLACFDAGDRIALARPGYPAYRNILHALDLTPVEIPTGPETQFRLTPETLTETMARQGPVDGLLLASPANPTGTVTPPAELKALADMCRANGIRLISDEIYHGLTFGADLATAVDSSDEAVVVNSFSKYYCMTGWRVGWMIVPDNLTRTVECLSQNLFVCAPAPSQKGALAAFDCKEELDALARTYRRNRDTLLAALTDMGITRIAPADGGFYLYADISGFAADSLDFCRRALEETHVAITPGIDFDPVAGHRYIRFSLAARPERIADAADRLATWLKSESGNVR